MMFEMTGTRTIQTAFGSFICVPHVTRVITGIAYKESTSLLRSYLNRRHRNRGGPFRLRTRMSIGFVDHVYKKKSAASHMLPIEVSLRVDNGDL